MKDTIKLQCALNSIEVIRIMSGQFKAGFLTKDNYLKAIENIIINTQTMIND